MEEKVHDAILQKSRDSVLHWISQHCSCLLTESSHIRIGDSMLYEIFINCLSLNYLYVGKIDLYLGLNTSIP